MMTLGEVLDAAQLRLGMMKDSLGWNTQRPVVLQFLHSAVQLLEADFADRLRYRPNVLIEPLEVGRYDNPESITAYELPDGADAFHIEKVSALYSGIWHTLERGITQDMRDTPFSPGDTFTRWDIVDGPALELWPNPGRPHRVRLSYYVTPMDILTADEACPVDMDPELLVLMTLNQAAPYFGRPDTESIRNHLNAYLANKRSEQLKGLRFVKGDRRRLARTPDDLDLAYLYPGASA